MHSRTLALVTFAATGLVATQAPPGQATAAAGPIKSARVASNEAAATKEAWGELRAYFQGETYGLRDVLTGTVTLEPGQEPHPPHTHAEEEFLYVVEGSGQWHLNGKDFAAAKGDTIYTEPWVVHGIKNTGTTPLTFVVVKWNTKGMVVPKQPATD